MRCAVLALAGIACLSALPCSSFAQALGDPGPAAEEGDKWIGDNQYSEGSSYSYEAPTPLQIVQQKAQRRAMARIRRLETMANFGMSNSRPAATPLPMTGVYSPTWQMPGGRPYGWYTTERPVFYLWR
ncbi:MAG: hypothetical protein AAGJ46_15455 [Planctomycetota bacterium]